VAEVCRGKRESSASKGFRATLSTDGGEITSTRRGYGASSISVARNVPNFKRHTTEEVRTQFAGK